MHGPEPHKEIEVKLELPPASIAELKKSPLLRTLKVAPKHPTEVSVYFDTDKHELRKRRSYSRLHATLPRLFLRGLQ